MRGGGLVAMGCGFETGALRVWSCVCRRRASVLYQQVLARGIRPLACQRMMLQTWDAWRHGSRHGMTLEHVWEMRGWKKGTRHADILSAEMGFREGIFARRCCLRGGRESSRHSRNQNSHKEQAVWSIFQHASVAPSTSPPDHLLNPALFSPGITMQLCP